MIYEEIELNSLYDLPNSDKCHAKLKIYIPESIDSHGYKSVPRKSVLVIPGGAYRRCSEREAEPIALEFLSMGYNAFILYYSAFPDGKYPQMFIETAAAFDIILKNSERWLCDPEKIAICGFSAGGHLAAYYSNAYSSPEIKEYFPDAKRPDAVILCYPVITAERDYSHKASCRNMLGKDILSPEEAEKFSADNIVSSDTPPTFIWHTASDQIVNVKNSIVYGEALKKNNIHFEMHIYPYGQHGLSTADGQTNAEISPEAKLAHSWIASANKWLEITL